MAPPPGGVRTAISGLVARMTGRTPARQAQPPMLPGAPMATYTYGAQNLSGSIDITQFRDTFQPEGTGGTMFAPGYPLVPTQPERLRTWDYPVGFNYIYTPRAWEPISFADLRALADNHDITRLCIETRKDQIEKLGWTVKPTDEKNASAEALKRADAMLAFWQRPDGEQSFATWLRSALEDLLVLDAPAFEIRRDRKGDVIGLDVIDGSTIKPLIDETGRCPRPPAPAFEQVIHGRPWVLLTRDDLIYMPRNRRPQKAYGFSPVEQILTTVNIGLRRQGMQLQHFTEGNVPAGIINGPDGWNPEQTRQFQEWFDSILAGNTAMKTRVMFTPAGAKYQAFKEAPYKDLFDEWLARVVCYAFSLPPTPFVERAPNRSSSETLQEAAQAEGLAPLMGWVKRLFDEVIQHRMGQPDLEFAWSLDENLPPETEATIVDKYVRDGVYTLNEARDIIGLEPIDGGDENAVYLPSGPILWKDVINPPEPPPMPTGGSPGTPPNPKLAAPPTKSNQEAAAADKASAPFRQGRVVGAHRAAAQHKADAPSRAAVDREALEVLARARATRRISDPAPYRDRPA